VVNNPLPVLFVFSATPTRGRRTAGVSPA
jgi:hypothetical protein